MHYCYCIPLFSTVYCVLLHGLWYWLYNQRIRDGPRDFPHAYAAPFRPSEYSWQGTTGCYVSRRIYDYIPFFYAYKYISLSILCIPVSTCSFLPSHPTTQSDLSSIPDTHDIKTHCLPNPTTPPIFLIPLMPRKHHRRLTPGYSALTSPSVFPSLPTATSPTP